MTDRDGAARPTRAGVAVELDGARWRTLPVDAVVEAGLGIGARARPGARTALARRCGAPGASEVALRALARREHSRASLDARLARAGVRMHRASGRRARRGCGLVDDAAVRHAAGAAPRGAGCRRRARSGRSGAAGHRRGDRAGCDRPRSSRKRTRRTRSSSARGGAPGRSATSPRGGFRRRRSSPLIAEVERRSARMSRLHPDFPCKRVSSDSLKP